MVFQTEFPDRFSTSGKLCAVHIVDQENSSGGQAFIEQREVRLQLEHRDLRPEIQNKKFHL